MTNSVLVKPADLAKLVKFLETLTTMNKDFAQVLRAARKIAPQLTEKSILALGEVNYVQADMLGLLAEFILELKNSFPADLAPNTERSEKIICEVSNRLQ